MGKTRSAGNTEGLTAFTDVVYLSDKTDMPAEIRRLFRHKKVSSRLLPLDKYDEIRTRPDLVGTVLVDAEDMDTSQDLRLGRILESLERDNIGIILFTQRISRPVRSFSLVSSESSFSMPGTVESISLDDLWARICINLADRKKQNSGVTARLPVLTSLTERFWRDHPADQPQAEDAFVDGLKEQLHLAGLVQRDFLPSQLPNSEEVRWAATFLPAEWVSGDIYDIARIDEQHIGFYVADAVGHSMPAALLTMFIKQALQMRQTVENSYRIFAPAEVVRNLNQKMTGQKLSGYQFVTCCYCMLNLKTRQLSFARAGHPYPILLRKGQPPQQLETRGALLGVFDNAEFVQQTVQLEQGDRLLLYSDGAESLIGRLHDKEGFQYTDEFLALNDASITEIVDRLTEMATHRQVKPADIDDLTMIGLQLL
ncbi:MAG: PP2C family protein-serine/threonine phosphatase [Phycisphaerae bacterium]|nr:PP2C family protein-serine/threonine phosphatase [Phycisphaerae bacterium]